jgi:7-carboxy-7-deazaguanine synthase
MSDTGAEHMRVAEKFISINGEGTRAGELAVFVRFTGCNLRCSYCDTMWANEPGCPYEEMSPAQICDYVRSKGIANVTLTGGEPLLQKEMGELIVRLIRECGVRVEIETNGSVDLRPFAELSGGQSEGQPVEQRGEQSEGQPVEQRGEQSGGQSEGQPIERRGGQPGGRPIFTMDYKLPSSGFEDRMITENFRVLQAEDTVKFVSGSRQDLERAAQIIEEYGLLERCHVYFSPVFGKIEPAEIVDFMLERKMNRARIQIQMHKVIWDPDERGV